MNNLPAKIQQEQTLTQHQQALRLWTQVSPGQWGRLHTIQVSEKEQLGLKIPKDTITSVQEIDKLTPSSGSMDAAAKQKQGYLTLMAQTSNKQGKK